MSKTFFLTGHDFSPQKSASRNAILLTIWNFIGVNYCPFMKCNTCVKYVPNLLLDTETIFGAVGSENVRI